VTQLATIRVFGDGCLRQPCQPAEADSPAVLALLDTMWAVLVDDGGVGLAAPQIGVPLRVVVVRDPDQPEGQQRLDLVNPEVGETFGSAVSFEEGCLSFPGLYAPVVRPAGIAASWVSPRQGLARHHWRNEGLLARIIQHEIDHLDGVLLVDHLNFMARWSLAPRLLWIMARHLGDRVRGRGDKENQ